jgi:alpha-N-arabinofuranosidase
MFFDDDGSAYVLYNSVAPDDKPLYDGHRTIRMFAFDLATMSVTGEERILVNGGSDMSKNPIWIEGPHIFRKDGYYYLICAEGGTADLHSQVVFRSRGVWGPYESFEENPILTQRHLPIPRPDPVTTAGHADFVETPSGEWWAVFLATRPYILRSPQDEFYNTGRETWLAPVVWKDGWPRIDLGGDVVKYRYPAPDLPGQSPALIPTSGNFTYRDEFDEPSLRKSWMFLRTPRTAWYSLTDIPGSLRLRLRPETAAGTSNPTFLGHRQQHLTGSATVSLSFVTDKPNEKAGLLVFQSEKHFYFLGRSAEGGVPVVQLFRSNPGDPQNGAMELLASSSVANPDAPVVLRAEMKRDIISFWFGETADGLRLVKDSVDATFLNTRYPQGFVGCVYALYATSHGRPSDAVTDVHWFEVSGKDHMYEQ